MNKDEMRAAIVAEARTWLWTKFHHRAMVKGAGVDCAHLLYAVYKEVGLIEAVEPRDYSPDWFWHLKEEWFLDELKNKYKFSEIKRDPLPGDVVLFKIGHVFGHGAIVTSWPKVIHTWPSGLGIVAEIDIMADTTWGGRDKIFLEPDWKES